MRPIAPELLGRLYREHAPALLLFARQWGDGAEDIVHAAFVKLAQQLALPDHVLPWLYRVVRNEALAASRSAARRRHREQHASHGEAWFAAVDDQLDAREASRLLAELPLDLREVIVARLWGELTFDEIARLVNCALPTAHRRYQMGLALLKERLEGRCTRTTPTPTTT
jgi:RNA polymerase sigma-70 factor (ECF subfamily)